MDDFALYVLHPADNHFYLNVVEGDTFSPIERSAIGYHPNSISHPIIDENILFLPAVDGRILGLDKYSHDQVVDVDLGPMMASRNPVCDSENIYTVCSIPISNRHQTDTDISVICINDKKTGSKKSQTCVLQGQMSLLAIDEYIWVSHNKTISRFSLDGEQQKTAVLSFQQAYSPYTTAESIYALSPFGAIEIFDRNLKPKGRLMASRNNCSPVRRDNLLYWPTKGQMMKINLDTEQVEKLGAIPFTPKGNPVFHGNHAYLATEEGKLVSFDVNTGESKHLPLGEVLHQPEIIDNNLFIASEKEMFQICLNMQ